MWENMKSLLLGYSSFLLTMDIWKGFTRYLCNCVCVCVDWGRCMCVSVSAWVNMCVCVCVSAPLPLHPPLSQHGAADRPKRGLLVFWSLFFPPRHAYVTLAEAISLMKAPPFHPHWVKGRALTWMAGKRSPCNVSLLLENRIMWHRHTASAKRDNTAPPQTGIM